MEIVLVAIGFVGLLAWGDLLVARLMPWHSEHPLGRALTGFGLLFGAGSYLIHALGFAALLYRPLAYAVVLVCATGIVLWLADRYRLGETSPWKRPATVLPDNLLAAALCVMVAINLLGCLTPEVRDDCLINHLSIPASFANAHRIEIHPFNIDMSRPQLIHMYYLLPLLFQNVFGAKLIHTMIALVGLAAMGWLTVRVCEKGALWLSLYVFYSLPVVTLYATCAYIDLGRIYFEVFPLWLILRYQQERRRSDLVLAAVIFGFGMGVHGLSSLFGWPVLTATVFFAVVAQGGSGRWKRALVAALGFGALSAAVFAPWIVRNWFLMGNPCREIFGGPAGIDQSQLLNPALARPVLAIWELPRRLYEAIWVISVSGNCPPILLVIALVLKLALRDRDPRQTVMLLFAFFHLFLFAVMLPIQDGRYILPGFAVSVILVFHYAERLMASRRVYRVCLVAGVLALGLLNFATSKYRLYLPTPDGYGEPPWPVYSRATGERFLENRFGDRRMIHYLNEQLLPGSKVLLDDMTGPLYVWRPFMTRNYRDPRILYTLIRQTGDNDALLARLRGYGLTHILIEGDPPPDGLTAAQLARLFSFAEQHLQLVHQVGDQRLFAIVE